MKEASARKGRNNERDTGLTAMFGLSRREESLSTRAAEEVEAKIPTYSSAKGFQMLGCVVERQLHPQGQGQQSPSHPQAFSDAKVIARQSELSR